MQQQQQQQMMQQQLQYNCVYVRIIPGACEAAKCVCGSAAAALSSALLGLSGLMEDCLLSTTAGYF